MGLPVRRHHGDADDRDPLLVSGHVTACPLRFPVPLRACRAGAAAGHASGNVRGSQGYFALSHRRNGDGAVQDVGGSWIYPEPSLFRIGGVPLFTGFMYSCIGSYLCRAWRLFDFHFEHHPPVWALVVVSIAIYINFFAHHYVPDMRLVLFAATLFLFRRTRIHFKVWDVYRSMPLLLGLILVAVFIWFSENIGTYSRTWLYPGQINGWTMVSVAKLGSWYLLLIISYTLVALINKPAEIDAADEPSRRSPSLENI
jgi:Protein of unknown function (DUF817)